MGKVSPEKCELSFVEHLPDDTTTATVECAGRHACPTWADGKAFTVKDGVIFDRRVALKARSELVIKVTIRTQAKCTAGQKITVTNKVFVGKGKGVDVASRAVARLIRWKSVV